MTDQPLNQQLDQWKMRLDTITNNVLDLYGAESSKLIRACLNDPVNGFSGITRTKAAHAMAALDELVQLYTSLRNVMDEAFSLVRHGSVLRKNEERVKALLYGQSILMQTQQVLVRNRGLLDDGNREVRATPSQVLAAMEQSFAEARDAVNTIADAMAHTEPRLDAVGQKIVALDSWARTLGVARPAPLADTVLPLSRVKRDPIGCATEIDQLEASVAQWRAQLETIDTDRKEVMASIARGKAALVELRDLVARSAGVYAEARDTIAGSAGLQPPIGPEAVEALELWLRTLEQNALTGRLSAVKVGVAKWERACGDRLNEERANYTRSSAALDERAELRGRFTALCAKADALKARGAAIGQAADAARRQGKSVLEAIPFDLEAGRRVVEALAAALATPSK